MRHLYILQLQPLVPVHQFDTLPSYFIFAGLVFIPLTQPYLHEYGEDWYNTSPRRLCERALRELPKRAGEQLVILSQVFLFHYWSVIFFFSIFYLICESRNLYYHPTNICSARKNYKWEETWESGNSYRNNSTSTDHICLWEEIKKWKWLLY